MVETAVRSPRWSLRDPRSLAWVATAAVVAAPYPFVVIGYALSILAQGTSPTTFAVPVSGDSIRLELDWRAWTVLLLVVLLGVLMLLSLVRSLLGYEGARFAAVLWLALTIPFVAAWFHTYQRCSHRSYSDSDVCISRGASTLRDTIVFGLPAMVALVCLVRAERLERRAGHETA